MTLGVGVGTIPPSSNETSGPTGKVKDMARRRYQRGCLRKEGDRWTIRYREDVLTATGEVVRRMRNRTIGLVADLPTERAARRAADAFLLKLNATAHRPGMVITFGDFAERWRAAALPTLKLTTQRVSAGQLDGYLIPAFGRLPLERITPEIVQGLVVQLAGKLRRHTILNILGTLSSIVNTARKWGYIVAEYSRDALTIPRDSTPARRPHFTHEQVHSIIEAADEPWRTLFATFAATGMRGAEVLALTLDDIDFAGSRILVRRSTQSGVMQLPKSERSVRTLPLPSELAWVLKGYIDRHYRPNPMRLLWCSGEGNPLWLDHVRERRLWPILDALGIPRCGFHAFRRTNGTTFASAGAPVKVAQEQLGHADPRVTLAIYQQVVDVEHRKAAGKVARILLPTCYSEERNALM